MNELIKPFLSHSADSLDDAAYLYRDGRLLALANRTYYAIFYAASALLLTEDIVTKKHEGARVKFHELFVKTGRFSREAGQILERAFEARQSADYDMDTHITDEQAQMLLTDAQTFYDLTVDYLNGLSQ